MVNSVLFHTFTTSSSYAPSLCFNPIQTMKFFLLLATVVPTAAFTTGFAPSRTTTYAAQSSNFQLNAVADGVANGTDKKKIIILGGDGFCGWPTSLYLSDQGHDVVIVDNLSRRNIDTELGCDSLTPIQPPDVSFLYLVLSFFVCRIRCACVILLDLKECHVLFDWVVCYFGCYY